MMTFNGTITLWAAIVSLLLIAFLIKGVAKMLETKKRHGRGPKLVEVGKEKEIFFVPGDEYLEGDDERRTR